MRNCHRNSSMFKDVPSHIRHAEKITEEQADEYLTAEPWSPEVSKLDKSSSSPSPTTALRRSQRQTRLLAKLKDFVLLARQNQTIEALQLNFVTIKHVPIYRFQLSKISCLSPSFRYTRIQVCNQEGERCSVYDSCHSHCSECARGPKEKEFFRLVGYRLARCLNIVVSVNHKRFT